MFFHQCNKMTKFFLKNMKNVTKIEVHGGAEPVGAFLEVVDDESIVSPNQLGVNNQAFEQLNLPEGANVTVSLATVPSSVASIKRKISGNVLYDSEYKAIIKDITAKKYSNMDVASFLVATGSFMTVQEVLALTEALAGDNFMHLDNENITSDAERNVVVASNSSAEQTNETEDNAQDEDVAEANALLKDESDTDNEKTDLVDEAAIEAQMSSEVYELSLSSHVDVFKKS